MCWLVAVRARPERRYQIGLRGIEAQATRTASAQLDTKWALEVLASRAVDHFEQLRSPIAVMSCTFCRTNVAGTVVMDWVRTIISINPAAPYPICSPMPRLGQTSRASGCLGESPLENMTEVSPESPREFMH